MARELARRVAGPPEEGAEGSIQVAGTSRGGGDGADALRRAAPEAGAAEALRAVALRVARVMSPALSVQRSGARHGGCGRETGRGARRAAHRGGVGWSGAGSAGEGKGERDTRHQCRDPG